MTHTQEKVEWLTFNEPGSAVIKCEIFVESGTIARMLGGNNEISNEKVMASREANAQRFASLWNAADGMTTEEAVDSLNFGRALFEKGVFPTETPTEQAVKYIEHGAEMVEFVQWVRKNTVCSDSLMDDAKELLAKLEAE